MEERTSQLCEIDSGFGKTRVNGGYRVLSRRLKHKFDIFGGLPDTIEDDWIETEERMEEMMDEYIHLRQKAREVFELRYKETVDSDQNRWVTCRRGCAPNQLPAQQNSN
jgi:hypothetical protein